MLLTNQNQGYLFPVVCVSKSIFYSILAIQGISTDTCVCYELFVGAEDHYDHNTPKTLRKAIESLITSLIRKTLVKVVLVFGPYTMALVRRVYQSTLQAPFILNLGCLKINTYLDVVDGDIKAIFLEYISLAEDLGDPWSKRAKFVRVVLQFTRTITETPVIITNWYQSAATPWQMLYYYRCEQIGAPQIQFSTCKKSILGFFKQYGFDAREELERLQNEAGTLIKAAAMLISAALPGKTSKRERVSYFEADIRAMARMLRRQNSNSRRQFKKSVFERVKQNVSHRIATEQKVHLNAPKSMESIQTACRFGDKQKQDQDLQDEQVVQSISSCVSMIG
jgi:hypothetical protein